MHSQWATSEIICANESLRDKLVKDHTQSSKFQKELPKVSGERTGEERKK